MEKQVWTKCTKLFDEGKGIKREHGRNRYCNMSEQGKQNLREYQKYYCKAKKISLEKLYFLYIAEKMSKAI